MILVTAATAPVGRAIVEQLTAMDRPVRVLTRNPAEAGLPAGIDVVAGDLSDADCLAEALAGVEAVFLLAVAAGFAPAFLAAAEQAGVRRIVFQSSAAIVDAADEQTSEVAAFHHDIERQIVASGLEWTFLRLEVASSDALQWAFDLPGQLAAGDVVRGPWADAQVSPVHPADVAALATAALTGSGPGGDVHAGAVYQVAGPVSMTLREQVEAIGAAHGRSLTYVELDEAAAREAMSPYAPADLLLATWAAHRGVPAPVDSVLWRVTGQPPRTVRHWAADYPVPEVK